MDISVIKPIKSCIVILTNLLSSRITALPYLISPIPDELFVTNRSCASDTPITSAILELSVFACFKSATNSDLTLSQLSLQIIINNTHSNWNLLRKCITKLFTCWFFYNVILPKYSVNFHCVVYL